MFSAFSNPAGLITFAMETLVPLRKCKGLQPSSPIFLIAWAANFGLEKLRKTSAPDASRAPQATAITFLPSMESEPICLTHGAFLSRLHRMARLFRGLGVARGDVVTLLVPNIPDAVVALWAAEAIGIAHPVNTLLRAQDIAATMRAAGSRVLVALGPQAC